MGTAQAVGGVLAGLATYFGLALVGVENPPQQFKLVLQDGRVLTDAEAVASYNAHPGAEYRELSWDSVPGWMPSATFIARFVLAGCILPPVAGAIVAILIAKWL